MHPISNTPSGTHMVLIPCYNPGAKIEQTIRQVRVQWNPVWVVVDGSTDGSTVILKNLAMQDNGLKVWELPINQGKGAAVLFGLQQAQTAGFTHVLTMDADGQHPAALIPAFMQASCKQPKAMVLGLPVFDSSAPRLRVYGRKVSNFWAQLETLWSGIGDSLYGFRVYPVVPLMQIMQKQRWMRRFDFDPEAAVRLSWAKVPAVNIPAPVQYYSPEQGGVSHFKYLRDNTLLTWMHTRLMLGFACRLPILLARKLKPAAN